MKFELGQWFLLPGVEAIYPRTVTNVIVEDDAPHRTGLRP